MLASFAPLTLLASLVLAGGHADTHRAPAKDARNRTAVTVLRGDVRWGRDRTHELRGTTTLAAGATLTIEPGATILADTGATLVIPRDGRINAVGTLLEPIVLTCRDEVKYVGCWGGVVIAGNAPINHGTPTSPAPRGAGPAGCLEYADVSVVTTYGGCPFADSSGIMRYVRIEYSTRGLQLLGVGSATVIEKVQVHRSAGDGLTVTGGRVNLRFLVLTSNAQYGFHWTGGWSGNAQHIFVQGDPSFVAGGMLGQNGGVGTTIDDALPRSAPSIANVTIVLESLGSNPYGSLPASALVLEKGTAGDLRDFVLYQPNVALDVVGSSTCARVANGTLRLRGVLTGGAGSLGPTGSPAQSCATYPGPMPESQWLADASQQNVVVTDPAVIATILIHGSNIERPDVRPRFDSPAATLPVVGGGNAFFDVVPWRGGIEVAEPGRSNIPWYSGWTFGELLPTPALATLAGTVFSTVRGNLASVAISLDPSSRSTVSSPTGAYSIGSIPPGPVTARLSSIPQGCTVPPAETFILPAGASVSRDFGVPCTPLARLAIDAGAYHTCVLTAVGEAWCWGANASGQLGVGTLSPSAVPVKVQTTATYQAVSVSNLHSCALTSALAIQCWGGNAQGQLGIGDRSNRTSPVTVPGGPWKAVAAGAEHTCALDMSGVVSCWGQNSSGQLGTGNTTSSPTPVAVSAPVAFVGVAAGGLQSCAWDASGVAYCWGSNVTGALGITNPSSYTPTPVLTGFRFTSIEAGESYTCGVTTATQAVCWGTNVTGQLGVGAAGGQPFPTVISTNPVTLSLGASAEATILSHTCAIVTGGRAWCWGHNSSGQLGTETTTLCSYAVFSVPCSFSPLPVDGGLTFARVVTGASHSCGLTLAQEVWCWGSDSDGQLGDGGSGTSLLPVRVVGQLNLP